MHSQTEVKQFSVQSLQSDLNAEDDKAQVCPLKALNTISFTLASWGESESQAPAEIRQGSLKHAHTHIHYHPQARERESNKSVHHLLKAGGAVPGCQTITREKCE